MVQPKQFRVSGQDDEGDIHVFETDDQARAESMRGQMHEDLQDVMIENRGQRSGAAD